MDAVTIEFVIGALVAVSGIALGEHRARQARTRLDQMPAEIAEGVAAVLGDVPVARSKSEGSPAEELGAYAGYVDLDGDGRSELVVQHPAGVHGMAFKVFGWGDIGFDLLGQTGSGTPTSVRIEDVDGDGKLEVGILEVDWDAGRSYVDALRVEQFYRWTGNEFMPVGTGAHFDPMTGDVREEVTVYFRPPEWAISVKRSTPANSTASRSGPLRSS